jgi:hypothetical protein
LEGLQKDLRGAETTLRNLSTEAAAAKLSDGVVIAPVDIPQQPRQQGRNRFFHGAARLLCALIRVPGYLTEEGKALANTVAGQWLALRRGGDVTVPQLENLAGVDFSETRGALRGGAQRKIRSDLDIVGLRGEFDTNLQLLKEETEAEYEVYFALAGWAGWVPSCIIPPVFKAGNVQVTHEDYRVVSMTGISTDGTHDTMTLETVITTPAWSVDGRTTLEQVLEKHEHGIMSVIPIGGWMERMGPEFSKMFPTSTFNDVTLGDGEVISGQFLTAASSAWSPAPIKRRFRRTADGIVADPRGRIHKAIQPSPGSVADALAAAPARTEGDNALKTFWVAKLSQEVAAQAMRDRSALNWLDGWATRLRGRVERPVTASVDTMMYEGPLAIRTGGLVPPTEEGSMEEASWLLSRGKWPAPADFSFESHRADFRVGDSYYEAPAAPVLELAQQRLGAVTGEARAIAHVAARPMPRKPVSPGLAAALAAMRGAPVAEVAATIEEEVATAEAVAEVIEEVVAETASGETEVIEEVVTSAEDFSDADDTSLDSLTPELSAEEEEEFAAVAADVLHEELEGGQSEEEDEDPA